MDTLSYQKELNITYPGQLWKLKVSLAFFSDYMKCINKFGKLTKPLTVYVNKDAKIEHTTEFLLCIKYLKRLLTNKPLLLQYSYFTKQITVTTDASNLAIVEILLHSMKQK